MDKNLKIIQINLQKSKTATSELIGQLLEERFMIALIQKTYEIEVGSGFRIPCLNAIKCISKSDEKFRAAILYNGKYVKPLGLSQLSTEGISVMSLCHSNITKIFVSVYLPPTTNLTEELPALKKVISETQGHKICIGGDFNAKSTLWYDHKTDPKAIIL